MFCCSEDISKLLHCMSLLLAQSRHLDTLDQCPLSEVKRTSARLSEMSAFDPNQTSSSCSKFSRVAHRALARLDSVACEGPRG